MRWINLQYRSYFISLYDAILNACFWWKAAKPRLWASIASKHHEQRLKWSPRLRLSSTCCAVIEGRFKGNRAVVTNDDDLILSNCLDISFRQWLITFFDGASYTVVVQLTSFGGYGNPKLLGVAGVESPQQRLVSQSCQIQPPYRRCRAPILEPSKRPQSSRPHLNANYWLTRLVTMKGSGVNWNAVVLAPKVPSKALNFLMSPTKCNNALMSWPGMAPVIRDALLLFALMMTKWRNTSSSVPYDVHRR